MTDVRSTGSPARAVAANSVWQMVTFAARAAAGLGTVFLVARLDGPRSLGVFQFALTLTALFHFASNLGLPQLLTRQVSRHPETVRDWLQSGSFVGLCMGAALTVLFAAGVGLADVSEEMAVSIVLAALGMAFEGVARIEFAAFWAWERMRLEGIATCIQEAAFLGGTGLALWMGGGVEGALVAYCGSRALGAVVGWAMASARLQHPLVPRPDFGFLRRILPGTVPFAVNDALTLTYMRVDAVLLGFVHGPVAVGLYQACTNLVLYLNVLARSLNNALYPRMSKAWPGNPRALGRLRDVSLRSLAALSLPIAITSFMLAPRIIEFLYGPRFSKAVLTYQLLVLIIPIRMLGHTLGTSLTAADGHTTRMKAVAAAAAANVALNLYFIPRWSHVGAAITTVVCETGLFVAYAALLKRVAGRSALASAFTLPAAASIVLAATLLVTTRLHVVAAVAVGMASYAAALLLLALWRSPPQNRRSPAALLQAVLAEST